MTGKSGDDQTIFNSDKHQKHRKFFERINSGEIA